MCTRLIASPVRVRKRWFMLFQRDLPWECKLYLNKRTPDWNFYMNWMGTFAYPTYYEVTHKHAWYRFATKAEAMAMKHAIDNELWCLKCRAVPLASSCPKKV